jgi:hypothetical protein
MMSTSESGMRRIDVFFYGLFMDEALLHEKGVRPGSMQPASVRGFQLRIGRRATLVANAAGCAYGIVASLTHRELDQLYSDPSLRDYRPEAVLAAISNSHSVPALCFNLMAPPSPDERNIDYARKLRALAQRLGFPPDYLASIE